MSRRAVLTGVVLVAVFLAGALSGAAVYRMSARAGADSPAVESSFADADGREGFLDDSGPRLGGDRPDLTFLFAEHLDEELSLSEEQRERIEAILERREAGARQIFTETRDRFEAYLEEALAEVEAVLTPVQAEEFRSMVESLEERFRERDGGERDGGG